MRRRKFLQAAALPALALVLGAPAVQAALLPADAWFGRTLDDLRGRTVALSDFVGQPLLVNFWASWCTPCVREMPLLDQTARTHHDLTVLGVAIDTPGNVAGFLQKTPVSYKILLAGDDGLTLMRDLGNRQGLLPFSVFFSRQGRAQDTVLGELQPAALQAHLKQIL